MAEYINNRFLDPDVAHTAARTKIDTYYSRCLTTKDPKMFLSFASHLCAFLQATPSTKMGASSQQCHHQLIDEVSWYLYQYKQSSFVFRHKETYVICMDDFETIQLTRDDIRRWYVLFNNIS